MTEDTISENCILLYRPQPLHLQWHDKETGIKKIANAPAYVVEKPDTGCEEQYVIEYRWEKRDTNKAGNYIGQFKIVFSDKLKLDGKTYLSGEMIVPIAEDLFIVISDSGLK